MVAPKNVQWSEGLNSERESLVQFFDGAGTESRLGGKEEKEQMEKTKQRIGKEPKQRIKREVATKRGANDLWRSKNYSFCYALPVPVG